MIILIIILVIIGLWGYFDYKKIDDCQKIRQTGGLKRLYPNFVEYFHSDFAILSTIYGDLVPGFLHDTTGREIEAAYGNEKITKEGKYIKPLPFRIIIGVKHSSIKEYYCLIQSHQGKDFEKVKVAVTNRKEELSLFEYHEVFNNLYDELKKKTTVLNYVLPNLF